MRLWHRGYGTGAMAQGLWPGAREAGEMGSGAQVLCSKSKSKHRSISPTVRYKPEVSDILTIHSDQCKCQNEYTLAYQSGLEQKRTLDY